MLNFTEAEIIPAPRSIPGARTVYRVIAIDKLIDVQNLGFGSDEITRALELLNARLHRIS